MQWMAWRRCALIRILIGVEADCRLSRSAPPSSSYWCIFERRSIVGRRRNPERPADIDTKTGVRRAGPTCHHATQRKQSQQSCFFHIRLEYSTEICRRRHTPSLCIQYTQNGNVSTALFQFVTQFKNTVHGATKPHTRGFAGSGNDNAA